MNDLELKQIIEALLLSHQGPLSLEKMRLVFSEEHKPDLKQLKSLLLVLKSEYSIRPCELIEVAEGYVVQTKKEYAPWIARLHADKPVKYSRALLEILAIIAYKQPVTRSDIEDIRGVAVSSQIIKTLMEREWIEIAGYKDVPGKPAIYCTSKEFLNYFNLCQLNELPSLELRL
ncbi:MAG: SMC-Scp complex subunit ScpB [Legionella sp.]|nr:SMC-Scp complex subunit ScpB [Legionella sp.]